MTQALSTSFRLRAEARLKNGRLVDLRERTGLTQAAFAARIGIDHSTYCGYETMRLYPSPAHAGLLADLAGCEVEELFPEALRVVAKERLPRTAVTVADIEPERLLTAVPREPLALPQPAEAESPVDLIHRAEVLACIRSTLGDLPPRDRALLLRYFGLDGRPPETLEAIGERYGIGPKRAWQILKRAMRPIERALTRAGLAPARPRLVPLEAGWNRKQPLNLPYLRHLASTEALHGCPKGDFQPLYRFDGKLVRRPETVPTSGVYDGIFCSACGEELRLYLKTHVARIDFGALARRGENGRRTARQMLSRITATRAVDQAYYGVKAYEAAFKRRRAEEKAKFRNA